MLRLRLYYGKCWGYIGVILENGKMEPLGIVGII